MRRSAANQIEDILGPGDIVTYHLPHNLHHDTDTGAETEKRWCVHYHMTSNISEMNPSHIKAGSMAKGSDT